MKKIILFTSALLLAINSFATHNMSGDITYIHLWGNAYRFTVRTFTNTANTSADRCELVLHVGNDSITIPRINGPSTLCPSTHDGEMICTSVKYNVYQGDISLPGNGTYSFSVSDQNLNAGICNVPNSVNTPFTMFGEMVINSALGYNNTPIYTGAGLIQNNVGVISTYNPAVINAQGDSLYYDFLLTNVSALPSASNSLSINHQNGVITWDAPNTVCFYIIDVSMKQYKNVGGVYYYTGTTMQEIFTTNTCVPALLVNETTVNNEITVYPNPAQDNIQIALGTNKADHIIITNVLGAVIKTMENKTDNSTLTIDLGDVKKGIYFVEIFNTKEGLVSENKNKVYRKIIVQ